MQPVRTVTEKKRDCRWWKCRRGYVLDRKPSYVLYVLSACGSLSLVARAADADGAPLALALTYPQAFEPRQAALDYLAKVISALPLLQPRTFHTSNVPIPYLCPSAPQTDRQTGVIATTRTCSTSSPACLAPRVPRGTRAEGSLPTRLRELPLARDRGIQDSELRAVTGVPSVTVAASASSP